MRLVRWATVLVLLAGASNLAAQTDPRLVAAVRSAQEGQGDSARASIQRLLDATPPTDSLYPEILYTQAMVADNAADMRRSLQRVVVEYPTSDWSDDALVRLVQMDYATRSFDAAARDGVVDDLDRAAIDMAGISRRIDVGAPGRYFFDSAEEEPGAQALDDDAARRLWDYSEQLLRQLGH